jgi:hypothetical protein
MLLMDDTPPRPAAVTPPVPLGADFWFDAHALVRDLVSGMLCLAGIAVGLDLWLFCGGVIASYDLRALFDATREGGLLSWLTVTQAGLIALTLWAMVAAFGRAGLPRARRIGWAVLAACFTYLAFDDGVRLHERIGTAFDEAGASEAGLGAAFPSYYWQLLLGPFFAAMGLFVAGFLWKELRAKRLRLLVGGALALLAFAVALDFVEGLNPAHPLNAYAYLAEAWRLEPHAQVLFGMPAFDAVVHFSMVLEEGIEMMAMTVLWGVFLLHALGTLSGVRLQWAAGGAEGSLAEAEAVAVA